MREKFARFMYGRNGLDELGKAENIFILILLVIGLFPRVLPLYILTLVLIGHLYFRMFSKNLNKRRAENLKYTTMRYQTAIKWNKWKTHLKQKKDYRFFKCPACAQKVRVPKGHGKIEVTCPKCREKFVRKS